MAELSRVPDEQSFGLINFLLYKEWAEYPPGTVTEKITGEPAYVRYSELCIPCMNKVGGYAVCRGKFSANLIGPADEHWDEIIIMQYPNKGAFERMLSDPDYLKVIFHRTAGIKDSRLYGIISSQSIGPARWKLFQLSKKLGHQG